MPKVRKVVFGPDRLERAIARRLLKLTELEHRVGCSASTLWIARKGRGVSLSVGKRIAKVLRCELGDLLVGGDGEPAHVLEGAAAAGSLVKTDKVDAALGGASGGVCVRAAAG